MYVSLIITYLEYPFIRLESLGLSIGGLEIPIIKISNINEETQKYDDKPVIVVVGRQHSGETHSSFVIHGLLNQLLRRDVLVNKFRERFETWFIPMINPDGVVTGNYRSNLQGKDMNRNFYADDDKECKERCYEVELLR